LVTGIAGLAGGVLLAAAADGSLLRADPAVLAGTPFSDWRMPGVLLAGLVGGDFLLAGWWPWRGHRYARELSMAAGSGLVFFEAAELAWLGVPAARSGVRGCRCDHYRARVAPAQDAAMTRPSVQLQLAASAMPSGFVAAASDRLAGSGHDPGRRQRPRTTIVSPVGGGP
jgi:hypothetical protein